ncbi:POT family MFS transporter [uncultured Gimesia sp.]|jgi:proton-dependent oligopeptide transporter, POT family|uniref:POT family MFS transporter n=1 Tax=uncultured Gimesia sp. TaxID=1678688 RepID=UPI00260F41EB|nr:POT family MFS transporter [uncultured Gimesia sp.]
MAQAKYKTAPVPSTRMPSGIPYIVGNETAERFSFYGMRGILVVFMTKYMLNSRGEADYMSDHDAAAVFHLFVATAYFFPLLGSLLSDVLWGKYKTILVLSIVYCFGHLALAIDDTRVGLFIGLILIALGAGGIKPCVSAHVGDQFGSQNKHLLSRVFGWFYLAINLGAFVSSLLIPVILEKYGPHYAFGLPGILMLLATILFWMGRNQFVHIPASGWKKFRTDTFGKEGLQALLNLSVLYYVFLPVFWALFDQTGSSWVLQGLQMNTLVTTPLGEFQLGAAQIQAFNPFFILILIPTFTYVVYPLIDKVFPLTPLRKISIGFFLTAASFAIVALIQIGIDRAPQNPPHILWQAVPYLVMTAGEVMISITCLEFSYTQAPKSMKSFIMSLYFLSVTVGNLLTAGVNKMIMIDEKTSRLEGASYFWFFSGLMFVAAILFIFVAQHYKGKTYIQDDEPDTSLAQEEGIQ